LKKTIHDLKDEMKRLEDDIKLKEKANKAASDVFKI